VTPVERIGLAVVPAVAMATMALGLTVGAREGARAAEVWAAPPASGAHTLAWQLVTIDDERGAREPIEIATVSVEGRAKGAVARWSGPTNADGVAEVRLELPGVAGGDRVTVDVRGPEGPLAEGDAVCPAPPVEDFRSAPATVRFARRDGDVTLDVVVYGEKLVPGYAAPIWVRATDRTGGAPLAGVAIEGSSDGSLELPVARATTDAGGWARVYARPVGLVVALVLHARAGAKEGDWAGAPPVAAGGALAQVPPRVPPGQATAFEVSVPTVRATAYAEIDDRSGRAAAAVLAMKPDSTGSLRGVFDAPPLAPGLYWLVTSGDPRGAASDAVSMVARPFFVAGSDDEAMQFKPHAADCSGAALERCLAQAVHPPFARVLALDGFAAQRARASERHDRGLALSLASVLVAAVIEALILLGSAARSRRVVAVELDAVGLPVHTEKRGVTLGTLLVALLVGLLGFVLLAVLLVRAS
jgi:hypothetical protein